MRTCALLIAALTASAGPVLASEPGDGLIPGSFGGNITLTSDYLVRGGSQSNNGPAIQGGLDWDTGVGLHFGVWGSSLNFKDGGQATTEIDWSGGYAGSLGDLLNYDIGAVYYWYPGAPGALSYDFWEAYGKVSRDFGRFILNGGVSYSPDIFGGTGPSTYFSAGLTVPITDKLRVSAAAGHSFLAQSNPTPAFFPDYLDWNAGARLSVNNWFTLDVRYYDTNIAGNCPAPGGKRWCGPKVVAAISRSF